MGYSKTRIRTVLTVLATIFMVTGVAVLLHQYLIWGVIFEISDIHHETFALMAFCMAFGLWIGVVLASKK